LQTNSTLWPAPCPVIRLICHSGRCWRLPLPALQQLLQKHSFWAQERTGTDLRRMLRGSQAVVSLWEGKQLLGFGRASSDGVYRAVLWDVVVADSHQGLGHGRALVEALLKHPALARVERVYLMTTHQRGFYEQLGFQAAEQQQLMLLKCRTAATTSCGESSK
jgi:ribosomal protein S18 acetylase RimI-like enzyme